ncbi:MAG TPA: efflux RND transporter periplasmic adaptor subunit [Micropepsaceae bacterium]|nr:efflux RND transporter periplasmic adaptor subunit [Micropepsaceae bacterium]
MRRYSLLLLACALNVPVPLSAVPSALVQLATVTSGVVSPAISGFGSVAADPAHTVAISVPRDVVPVTIPVRVGQLVRPGDVVATVTTAPAARSAWQQAQDAVAFAQKDLVHTRYLFGLRLATNSQVDAAVKALGDAQAQLQAQIRIGADKPAEIVRAAATGIVMAVNASPGQPVAANAVLMSIVPRDGLVVQLGLEPEDAARVHPGAIVILSSPQNPAVRFNTRITSVDAATDPKSRLVNAIASIPAADAAGLTLGMVLQASIEMPLRNGVVLPHDALMTDGAGPFVYVVNKGVAHRRPIRIAFTGNQAVVTQGLTPGEAVVVAGNSQLSDGTPVRTR